MTDKVTIKEAMKITGKSRATIYKYINKKITMVDRETLEKIINNKAGRPKKGVKNED